ncbi:hypothetical protein GU926_09460 [Nibribacter ruber]|uniref:Uncharacterized protein n=1 Tax=Nibribacter ruber TaxID=2698458 RepID=A0A6P1P056_9BACT|nr:hypothetical protein [Nibribacter ruber]QHL87651.1 hypothetical protein GU926_09460 [Nibribacter ruber]
MMQYLKLNELEYIKVKELNQARIAKISEVVYQYSNNMAMQETLCAEIEKDFEAKLAATLMKEKMAGYAAFKLTPEGDVLALVKNSSDKSPVQVK